MKSSLNRDYYIEFHKELDKKLHHFVTEHSPMLGLGGHDIRIPLVTYLFYQLTHEKEHYSQCRISGMDVNEAMGRIDRFLCMFDEDESDDVTDMEAQPDGRRHPWSEALQEYKGQLLVYVFNPRQLRYLIPLINKLNRPVILLADYELPEDTDLPDYVTGLNLEFSAWKKFANSYVERNFPCLFQYANTFSWLVSLLQPSGIVCLEGCHLQEQLLAVVANDCRVTIVCIQQGWLSFMRTGFRNLPLEAEGIGRLAKDKEEFKACLYDLLHSPQAMAEKNKEEWFTSTGEAALDRMVDYINREMK